MHHQDGFSFIEVVLVLVVVAIIGSMGYLGYTNFIMPKTQDASEVIIPGKIENKADLDKVDAALDAVLLDDNDTSQLDSATNF
jgi:prepilin-type N-terminal cleavage/methylation domain-containing protein